MLEAEHKMKLMFPRRPWETEPDHAEWTDEKMGMRCRIRRNPITLTLLGYVGVPTGNLLWGLSSRSDDSVLLLNAENCWRELDEHTHGGLTYAQEDDDGWWWFGFDTAHHDDFAPGLVMNMLGGHPKPALIDLYDPEDYKTWEFVDAEIRELKKRIYQLTEEILQQQGDDDNDYGPGDRFELGD
jgi:hypothetical protein